MLSKSVEETIQIGIQFGKSLNPNDIVCLKGDLAAGKTTFIKGIVMGAGDYLPDHVISPTFVYLNIYKGSKTIYHFDLYRLKGVDEFLEMGFEDLLFAGGICCIEWSERIESLIPPHCRIVTLSHVEENSRRIEIQ